MNKKRQTIWLVSMLSIMVVLSAYYLFTGDKAEQDEFAASDQDWNNLMINMLDDNAYDDDEAVLNDEPDADLDDEHSPDAPTSGNGIFNTEAQAVSASDYFIGLELSRQDMIARQIETLSGIASNSEKSDEEVAAAIEEIETLRMQQEKMESIEEQLAQHYAQAVIVQQDDKWRVVVQADKLEKSEATSIIDLVVDELKLGPESVSIALRP